MHQEQFISNLRARALDEIRRLGDSSAAVGIQHALGREDAFSLIEAANRCNTRLVHDTFVNYVLSAVDGTRPDDTEHHDIILRTGRGGYVLLELKAAAMRLRGANVSNAGGSPARVTVLALVASREESELEVLALPASSLRLASYGKKDGGWGLSLSRSRLAQWRAKGQLVGFSDAIESLKRLSEGRRG